MMPSASWYTCCVRTEWPLGRMYSYFGNRGISWQKCRGGQALKQFVRKGGMSFSRISHTWCLSGSVMCCEKNCRINFQWTVISVQHGAWIIETRQTTNDDESTPSLSYYRTDYLKLSFFLRIGINWNGLPMETVTDTIQSCCFFKFSLFFMSLLCCILKLVAMKKSTWYSIGQARRGDVKNAL